MALEAIVYPEDPFSYSYRDCFSLGGTPTPTPAASWSYDGYGGLEEDDHHNKALHRGILDNNINSEQEGRNANCWDPSSPSAMQNTRDGWDPSPTEPIAATRGRRKRRRSRSSKNKEDIESQRMTHIAVERNRRKQMNEYLAVLRSLMPPSYAQRGDQASIVGGAINFVKELEQMSQAMEAHKKTKQQQQPFAELFTFPQYSRSRATTHDHDPSDESTAQESSTMADRNQRKGVADIEVTMVESHANLKILSRKRPRQLLQLVAALQGLRLSVLHLNVTTVDQMVLYSLSVKMEEGCYLNNVDEIAAAVNQVLLRIAEDSAAFN